MEVSLDYYEQCPCGIWFYGPIEPRHPRSALHMRCRAIQICGPCFYGACNGCEGSRGQGWFCRCDHRAALCDVSDNLAFNMSMEYSAWLSAGCPSESDLFRSTNQKEN